MIKYIFLLLLFSSTIYSQQIYKSIEANFPIKSELFQVINEADDEFVFFVFNKKEINAYKFDSTFTIKDSIIGKFHKNSNLMIEGYSIQNKKYFTFWNDKSKKIHIKSFDFSNNKIEHKTLDNFSIQGQVICNTTINNRFYIISILKGTNTLHFHEFNGFDYQIIEIDLSNCNFINVANKKANLYELISYKSKIDDSNKIQSVSKSTKPSIVFGAHSKKIYNSDNELILTFDENNDFTQIVKVSFNDFSHKYIKITKPLLLYKNKNKVGNSFIFNQNILQLKSTKDELHFEIKNFNDETIKKYIIIKNQKNDFANSSVIQEFTTVNNLNIREDASYLLEKTHNLNPAITAFKYNQKNYVQFGAVSPVYKNINNNTPLMYGFVGSLLQVLLTANDETSNLLSHKDRDVVYSYFLFDDNFNLLNEKVEIMPFYNFREFLTQRDDELFTVFTFKGNQYYSAYNSKFKSNNFYKF